jgi:hypothetical protein
MLRLKSEGIFTVGGWLRREDASRLIATVGSSLLPADLDAEEVSLAARIPFRS